MNYIHSVQPCLNLADIGNVFPYFSASNNNTVFKRVGSEFDAVQTSVQPISNVFDSQTTFLPVLSSF